MSSEVQKYIETALDAKKDLFETKVIDFPKNRQVDNFNFWQIYNKLDVNEDGDQLKAVTGICFIIVVLIITGLYSNLI